MPAAPPPELEARLVELLRASKRSEAATLIVREYGPGVLGYLGRVLRDDGAARDTFAEFAAELWSALPKFAYRSRVKTWAYAIAYHCALKYRRGRARRRTRPLRDSEYSKLAASMGRTGQTFALTEAEQRLEILRRDLTDEEQTLLVLRLDRGLSWEEIAEVIGVDRDTTPPALRKRFSRLKARLRRAAERQGMISARGD